MQVHMDIHKYAKVYKVDIPGFTKVYHSVNRGRLNPVAPPCVRTQFKVVV